MTPGTSLRITDQMRTDLDILMKGGRTQTEAIRTAVRFMAQVCTTAWEYAGVPEGETPRVDFVKFSTRQMPMALEEF